MIKETTIYDFKTHISRYIAALEAGEYERIVVKRKNTPAIEVSLPKPEKKHKIPFGIWKGEMTKGQIDAFFDPALDKAIEEDFYASPLWSPDETAS